MKISVLLLAYVLVPHSVKHISPCGALVEVNGFHGLSCKLCSGKHLRHVSINVIIYRAYCRADVPAVKKSTGLTKTDVETPGWQHFSPMVRGLLCSLERYDCWYYGAFLRSNFVSFRWISCWTVVWTQVSKI